jgi:hypothetical protein
VIGVIWDDGPDAGRWIADRLAPFGPTVGHAVPIGYQAYAVAPVSAIEDLLDVLGSFTGDQAVHCAMWDGWGWWYDGEPPDGYPAGARRPDAEPLELPHRDYYLWTGPLAPVVAFCRESTTPPSLMWPEDRSWFAGAPIYTNEIAVAGTTAMIDAVLTDRRLTARRATPDDVLDIDD